MRAELAHLPSAGERRAFARGCLRAVAPHLVVGLLAYLLIVAGVAALARADGTRGPFTAMLFGTGLAAPPALWLLVRRERLIGAVAPSRAARITRWAYLVLVALCVVVATDTVAFALPREGGAVEPTGAALGLGVALAFLSAYTLLGLAQTGIAGRVPGRTLASGTVAGLVSGFGWCGLMPFDQTLAPSGTWPTIGYAAALAVIVVLVPGTAALIAARGAVPASTARADLSVGGRADAAARGGTTAAHADVAARMRQGTLAGLGAGTTAGLVILAGGWTLVWRRPGLLYSAALDKGPGWLPPDLVEGVVLSYLLVLFLAPLVGAGIGLLAGRLSRVRVAVPALVGVGALVYPMLWAVLVGDPTAFMGVGTTSVAFPSTGNTVLTSNGAQTFVLWGMRDPARPTRLATFNGDVRYAPDGRLLASRDSLWRVRDDARPVRLGHFAEGTPAAFSPDGRMLVVHDRVSTVLWNVADPQHPIRLAGLGRVSGDATFTPDGRALFLSDADAGTTTRWDLRDPTRPAVSASIPGWEVVISPDGATLAAAQLDGTFTLWSIARPGQPVRRATIQSLISYRRFAFSPDSHLLTAGGDGDHGTVELYSTSTSTRLAVLKPDPETPITQVGASDPLTTFAFAPDGRTLSVVVGNTSDSIWDVSDPATPVRQRTVTRPTSGPGVVAFSPDTSTVVGAANLGTNSVTLWKVG